MQIAGRTFGNPQLTGARAPFIDSSTKISFRPRIDGSCAVSVVGETEGMFQIQNATRDKRDQQLCLVGSCMGAERPQAIPSRDRSRSWWGRHSSGIVMIYLIVYRLSKSHLSKGGGSYNRKA